MQESAETRLYLVRHGETDWNRERRLQGSLDIPLNDVGIAQAHRLADHFAAVPIACVACSPLTRASATGTILASACGCPLYIDARLREVDHGSWSGLTLPDIGRRFPALVEHEQLRPAAFEVSGGESLADVSRRVADVLAELLARHAGESVLVVAHGITLALMACVANSVELARFPEHLPPNAGCVMLMFSHQALVASHTVPQ